MGAHIPELRESPVGSSSLSLQAGDCSRGKERICPRLHHGCRCHGQPPSRPTGSIPAPPPRASCTSGVASAPVSQHRLPELKCLLTQTGSLWNRLGSAPKTKEKNTKKADHRAPSTEEDDSELQRAWGALIIRRKNSLAKRRAG